MSEPSCHPSHASRQARDGECCACRPALPRRLRRNALLILRRRQLVAGRAPVRAAPRPRLGHSVLRHAVRTHAFAHPATAASISPSCLASCHLTPELIVAVGRGVAFWDAPAGCYSFYTRFTAGQTAPDPKTGKPRFVDDKFFRQAPWIRLRETFGSGSSISVGIAGQCGGPSLTASTRTVRG